ECVVADYPGVKLIRQDNRGLSAARNAGLVATQAEFILFLDADDKLEPIAIATNLRRFATLPEAGFVYGGYSLIDEQGGLIEHASFEDVGTHPYRALLRRNIVGMHGTVLYRRALLAGIGGFDTRLKACEDYDALLRLARLHQVGGGPEMLACYRRHGTNMSGDPHLMLKSVHEVLARQHAIARDDPDLLEAWSTGMRNATDHYLALAVHHFRQASPSGGDRAAALGHLGALIRDYPAQAARKAARRLARRIRERVPVRLSRRLERPSGPAAVRMGDLRRVTPIDPWFGAGRGKPVDRHYVEGFLARHAGDIRGRVLEIGDSSYTRLYGGERVERMDVFNLLPGGAQTTFSGDLAAAHDLPEAAFDCIVFTQTLHLIFDMQAALVSLWRALRPGGVLLVTVPFISTIDRGEWGDAWCWGLTATALRRLLEMRFGAEGVDVVSYGNVLVATAFLYGLAEHELTAAEFDAHDSRCPVLIAGRAQK
ncbi:MAG: glycosyltransferase, partial [Hyphomicrobiales bacterium]